MLTKSSNHRFSSFLIPIMVIVLAYFTGTKVITDAAMVFCLILVATIAFLFIKKPAWALAILVFLIIILFNIVRNSFFPSIRLPGLGGLFPHDILLLIFVSVISVRVLVGRSESIRSSVSYPIIALIILTIIEGIRSFLWGSSPAFLAGRIRPIAFYLVYFLIIGSFRREDELICYIKLLIAIGVMSAGIVYFQAITGTKLAYIAGTMADYNLYRALTAGMYLMPLVILLLFALMIGERRGIKFIKGSVPIFIWMVIAVLLTLIRSVWVSVLVSIGLIILLNIRRSKKIIIVSFLLAFFLIVALPVVGHVIGSKSLVYILSHRFSTIHSDVKELQGSFLSRKMMAQVRWDYMIHNSPLLGVGFREPTHDTKMGFQLDPTIYCAHNIVADLSVRYGLSGFFVFGWLFFAVFKQAIRLFRALSVSWQKSLVCGLLAFNIQALILSFATATFFRPDGIVILTSSWAVLELIERFHKQKLELGLKDGRSKIPSSPGT